MAYLLRTLITLMITSIFLTTMTALGWIYIGLTHIQLAIPTFIFTIFAQAFVMFYFIGVARLTENIERILKGEGNLSELFDEAPGDLTPYQKKTAQYVYQTTLSKRQTIPWTMLILVLGTLGFLLGGAHDTGMVRKIVHSGVVYGFIAASIIGFVRQWYYLGKTHKLLREIKALFSLPDGQM